MARKPRIHYPGALYHVTLRGNARQEIFFDDADRCRFYLLLQEGIERFGHRVLAFCLMSNHVHLAIQVGEVPLSRIMQNLSFRYTLWINRRRNRVGHLFQGRFKAFLVDADSHLLELTAYIHLNPVRAGLSAGPHVYPWSSHRAYLGLEAIPWLAADAVLGQFSSQLGRARTRFAQFVGDRLEQGHREDFYGKGSLDARIIGADRFIAEVLQHAAPLTEVRPDLEAVLLAVSALYGLAEEDLRAAGQNRLRAEARSLAAWAVLELTDATLSDLAVRVGRDLSTLSAGVRRLEARRLAEPAVAERRNVLRHMLEVATFKAPVL
jgi:putative transposase